MQHPQQIMQAPNITAGFKNNIIPQQIQQPTIQQIQQPLPQPLPIEIPQPIIQNPIPQQPIIQNPIPDQTLIITPKLPPLPSIPDAYTIFGYELQKKYVYIAFILVLGLLAYFLWKWWVTPKKVKKSKHAPYVPDEEEYEEEEEEDEEDEEEVFIPQYQHTSKNSETKNKKKDDE